MEPSCIRQDLIPGTSKLFGDFLYRFERVERFYSYNFQDPGSFHSAAAQLRYPDGRRQQLIQALREQNGDSEALRKLATAGAVAVVTGQQVGLLGGPCYTIFKALTAVRLAQELTKQGTEAVPVFWLASEDHDLAEVDHAWLFNQDEKPAKISLANAVSTGGPVGDVAVGQMPFEEIRMALGELPFADEVVERLRGSYASGATLSSGFKSFVKQMLSEFGLLYLDPLAPAIRAIAQPFLATAAERVPQLLGALKDRDAELASAGYHSQVHVDDGASLLFLLADGKRTPIRWKQGRFLTHDRSYQTSELQAMADRLSPNALLRPVMQDYLLPTVAYIGGPAEIAYMAQGQVLYEELLGRMPVIFPRNSLTLLDERAEKLLRKYGFRLPDLLDHPDKVNRKIAAQLVPPGLQSEFEALESSLSTTIAQLQAKLHSFDPTLEAAATKSAAKMRYQLSRLSQKTAQETLRRDERSGRDACYLINSIYPHRRLQERFYSVVPFLAKHGPDLPQRIFESVQVACPDHMVRVV